MTLLRPELPSPTPEMISHLPVSRGYPVPWFVAAPADGEEPDFRVIASEKVMDAVMHQRCWVCGQRIFGDTVAFMIGPMCSINRVSAEPPSHLTCAHYSVLACPFLTRPQMVRREKNLPEEAQEPAGIMLKRNPGVMLIWITSKGAYRARQVRDGLLFDVGEPADVEWWTHGREATRDEVMASISSGLPSLRELAEAEGNEAEEELEKKLAAALTLLPQ